MVTGTVLLLTGCSTLLLLLLLLLLATGSGTRDEMASCEMLTVMPVVASAAPATLEPTLGLAERLESSPAVKESL
jgi:hypothetical protein